MEILELIIEYIRINWIDIIGYIASMFVATTFYMKTMIPLRIIGIGSNMLFITYGFAQGLYPVLILHLFLFPLNIIRLREMKKLISDVKMASKYESAMEPLLPFMSKKRYKKGEVLFNKDDEADMMFYLNNGSIKLVDLGIDVGEKQLIGEMGIFSPFKKRTDTAVCNCDMDVYVITEDKINQLYYQNPEFGFYLIKLLTGRFINNKENARKKRLSDVADAAGTQNPNVTVVRE